MKKDTVMTGCDCCIYAKECKNEGNDRIYCLVRAMILTAGLDWDEWSARERKKMMDEEMKKYTVSVGTITAKWMPIAGADVAQCSNCGKIAPPMYKDYNYCPYCGSYITGEAKRNARVCESE